MAKRINKSKKDIVSDIQLVSDANRRRALVKDILFPHLIEMNESIAYSKVFLQAFSSIIEGAFDEMRKRVTIGSIKETLLEKMKKSFDLKDKTQKKEFDRYAQLIEKVSDISIQDMNYAIELPRFMDGYLMNKVGKESITTVPIEDILGK